MPTVRKRARRSALVLLPIIALVGCGRIWSSEHARLSRIGGELVQGSIPKDLLISDPSLVTLCQGIPERGGTTEVFPVFGDLPSPLKGGGGTHYIIIRNQSTYSLIIRLRYEPGNDRYRVLDFMIPRRLTSEFGKWSIDLNSLEYVERGEAALQRNDTLTAIAEFTTAIQLEPNYSNHYVNRGVAKSIGRDYASAIVDFDAALRINPANAGAYGNRGAARYNRGDVEGAIADYSEAIRLKRDYKEAYLNRGMAKHRRRDFEGALLDYEKALELDPSDSRTITFISDAKQRKL